MKNSQGRIRKAWMRKFRRAKEGRGYKLYRTPPITRETDNGPEVVYSGKLYILKDDGRQVVEHKDGKTGKISYEIVTA